MAARTSEIYAGARHLGSIYDGDMKFDHRDWLDSSRVRRDFLYGTSQQCTSLLFGDGQNCSGIGDQSPSTSPAKNATARAD